MKKMYILGELDMEQNKLKSIKEECVHRWGQADEKIENFTKNFDKWCVFSNNEEAELCIDLLSKFDYYSKQQVNKELKTMHEQLLGIFNFDPKFTIYTIIKDKYGRANSSMEYFQEYVHINKINRYSRIDDINLINPKMYENIQNVVIVDDCIGSTKTVKNFFEKYKERLTGKKIYLIMIHLMIESGNKLISYAEENHLDLTILCQNKRTKAFPDSSSKEILEKFKKICKDRKIDSKFIFGKDNVEALMSFYNNTPNNTLGIFWCNTEKNTPLFPRVDDEHPAWMLDQMKHSKEERKLQNYKNAR